jgi:AcrR family transcriptional regulator
MIDETTSKGRVVAAALRLAERQPWQKVSLCDIADEAGVPLADVAKDFATRQDVLAQFARLVDDAVLRKSERFEAGETARERLFDVLMTRFEVMAPYRAGLRSVTKAGGMPLQLVPQVLRSQHWMLEAAGIPSDGPVGAGRTLGLTSLYARTFATWLDDDDPGRAKTMAALDRRLRRVESAMSWVDDTCKSWSRSFDRLRGARRASAARTSPPASPDDTAQAPAANI